MKQIFNNTLNRTMENLISKYMSDATIASGRASATYDDTIECREWTLKMGESLLWCENQDRFYLTISRLVVRCRLTRSCAHPWCTEQWKSTEHIWSCGLESWIVEQKKNIWPDSICVHLLLNVNGKRCMQPITILWWPLDSTHFTTSFGLSIYHGYFITRTF